MLERQTVDGRPATVAYLDADFVPVERAAAVLVKVVFLDATGGILFLTPRKPAEQKAFDPNQPRDDHGRWSDTDGSGAAPTTPSSVDDKLLLINMNPDSKTEPFVRWKREVDARMDQLEREGEVGSKEYDQLAGMSGAIEMWRDAGAADRDSGRIAFLEVHGGPRDSDEPHKMLAAVALKFDPRTRTARIEYSGGIDHDAHVKALKMMVGAYGKTNRAARIEARAFNDDKDTISAFEEAGFRKIGTAADYGVQEMLWGTEEGPKLPSSVSPPDADNPLAIHIVEGTSPEFKARIESDIRSLPAATLAALAKSGTIVRCATALTDAYPYLKDQMPRGWTSGSTWDQAEGIFAHGDNSIGVSELYKTRDGSYRPGRRGVLHHEAGHALDAALDSASFKHARCLIAYRKDVAEIPEARRGELGYYLQDGEAGPQEAFAEVFASEAINGTATATVDVRPFFPRLTAYVRQAMKTGARVDKPADA